MPTDSIKLAELSIVRKWLALATDRENATPVSALPGVVGARRRKIAPSALALLTVLPKRIRDRSFLRGRTCRPTNSGRRYVCQRPFHSETQHQAVSAAERVAETA